MGLLKTQTKTPCCKCIDLERRCAETQHDHCPQRNVKQEADTTVTKAEEGKEAEAKKTKSHKKV